MAKSRTYRWRGFGEQAARPKLKPARKKRKRGITNKQAAFLAKLQREAGEKYGGDGMTLFEASREIDRLLKAKEDGGAKTTAH